MTMTYNYVLIRIAGAKKPHSSNVEEDVSQ